MWCLLSLAAAGDLAAAWAALADGDLAAARAGFAGSDAPLARAGQVWIAATEGDLDAVRSLLRGQAPRRADPELVVAAAHALRLETETRRALPWLRAACRVPLPDAAVPCALAPLWAEVRTRSTCTGCDELVLPLGYTGAQPLVAVSVDGGPPLPFLVDTGATTSLLTPAAARGLRPREDTRTVIGTPAGDIPTWYTLVDLGLGAATVRSVQVVVAELPLGGVAGLLAPHDVWPDRPVTLDMVRHELRVGDPGAGLVLPYLRHDLRPTLTVAAADRPGRPIVLDTGASATSVDARWEALGAPFPRQALDGEVRGAGGAAVVVGRSRVEVPVSAGPLGWTMVDPTVFPAGAPGRGPDSFGLLGPDLWTGRSLGLDPAGRTLRVSDPAVMEGWEPGASARFVVRYAGRERSFEEHVVARGDGRVTLEVRLDDGSVETLSTPDTWAARGGWVATRPDTSLADVGDALLALLPSFRTVGGGPRALRLEAPPAAGPGACTRATWDARRGPRAAVVEVLECPGDGWRVWAVALREPDGRVVWEMRRIRGPVARAPSPPGVQR